MTKIQGNKNVVLNGRGTVILRPNDYVATGGEGCIYRKSNTIIKLYTDSNRMSREDLTTKIKILSKLKHKFVVTPTNIVLDKNGNPIGFYMPFAKGEPLSRVFTNDFRTRNNFGDDDACALVDGMRDVVQFAHSSGAVLVDANELNWLVKLYKQKTPEPKIIDVDSWAIGKWGAKVIMPSIRDWHTNSFNDKSDWFAWGIITFQIFTGIHPYKGKLKGYKPFDLQTRMRDNASVFTEGVRLNRAVRDFKAIPGPLLDWYVKVFEKGDRSTPPSPFETGVALMHGARVLHIVNTTSGNLIFDLLYKDEFVEEIFTCGVVRTKSGKLIDLACGKCIAQEVSVKAEVIRIENGWLCADEVDGQYIFYYINATSLQKVMLACQIEFNKLIRHQNRLFGVNEKGLTEVCIKFFATPVLLLAQTWHLVVNSVDWFDGVGVQDAFGAIYVILPFGQNQCAQVRVRELDGTKVVNARAGHRFVTFVVLDGGGNYQKIELSFDKNYQHYKLWQGATDNPNLNIATLPKGVCATIVEDGKLDIFVPSSGTLNSVQDKDISTTMMLTNWDNKVIYLKNGQVWQLRMK